MNTDSKPAIEALNQAFIHNHPAQAQQAIHKLSTDDITALLMNQPVEDRIKLWNGLMLDKATVVLQRLPGKIIRQIIQHADPVQAARVLQRFNQAERESLLQGLDVARQRELTALAQYTEESAGWLMNPRFLSLHESLTVREVLHRLRKFKPRFSRQLYITDSEGKLQSMIEIHKIVMAEGSEILAHLAKPVPAVVPATATRLEVVGQLETHRVSDLPVVDLVGRLIGVIHYDALIEAVREESTVDILTMVGASRDERALSPVSFVIRKRLPWLSINLLTAFLAAAVVGLFENTIATFTALAVLLPVVAGQSGNTGAQALAVTMRGLALREIGTSQWWGVVRKEVGAGFINGIAIALMTATGVFFWSGSYGLTLVIGVSMIIAMVAAAFSGVIIPIVLSSLGQDPAQSSSIILTTVTDVVGFFAFLGIATMMSSML